LTTHYGIVNSIYIIIISSITSPKNNVSFRFRVLKLTKENRSLSSFWNVEPGANAKQTYLVKATAPEFLKKMMVLLK